MEEEEVGEAVYADKQLVIRRQPPHGLRVSGAIDYNNSEAVALALTRELQTSPAGAAALSDAITGNGDLQIDVTRLEFADVTGIRALVRVAENGRDGRRLVLRGLPPRIRMVIAVVGWSDLPNLVLEDAD